MLKKKNKSEHKHKRIKEEFNLYICNKDISIKNYRMKSNFKKTISQIK